MARRQSRRIQICMNAACEYDYCMTSLQIREIPEELHRRLKARAALEGQSMSEYVLRELRRSLDIPTRQEMMERIAALDRIEVTESPADAVRAIRDAR